MNGKSGASRIGQMSRGVGESRQASEGVSRGSAWTWRGGRKVEWMPRSEQEWMGEWKQLGDWRGRWKWLSEWTDEWM